MARLVIFDERVRGIDLPGHPVILGRSQRADIPIHDQILSRKHCTIVPTESGHRLIDLKSSNGTYLNGKRIERSDLKFDDVIEIGNTVIVLLDTETWRRGEGVTRLRNPVKAQELIQTINKKAVLWKDGKEPEEKRGERKADARRRRSLEAAFSAWAGEDLLSLPVAEDLMEGYVCHRIVSLAARRSGEIRDVVDAVIERVLKSNAFSGGPEALRQAVRRAVGEVLQEHRGDEEESDTDEDGGERETP